VTDAAWQAIKALVLRMPGTAILLGPILFIIYISVFLFATPACESRTFFGVAVDRTKLLECVQTPPSIGPGKTLDVNEVGKIDSLPKQDNTAMVPARTEALLPDVAFTNDGRADFRKRYGLSIVEAESATLEETPNNSFGFAYGGSFATVWNDKLETLTLRSSARSVHFELQKRNAGLVFIVGYMRGDSAKEIIKSRSYPTKIRLYSERYKESDAIVAIPIQLIKSVGQSTIDVSKANYIPVLDLEFN